MWTHEQESTLRELWARGLSAGMIRKEPDFTHLTRNAILGKVHRMQLPIRSTKIEDRAPVRNSYRARPKSVKITIWQALEKVYALSDTETGAEVPLAQRKSLIELTDKSCRWPIGHPGTDNFYFCGAETASLSRGQPYCRGHLKAAWRPA
jgi:GcrA cell cycle regulator